jgi:hypothetical protein
MAGNSPTTGFGPEYYGDTSRPLSSSAVKKNFAQVINAAFGQGYVMVHKFDKGLFVEYIDNVWPKISSSIKYSYPEKGKRIYAVASFDATIHGSTFKVNAQFRDTKTGVKKPTYLRINMVLK